MNGEHFDARSLQRFRDGEMNAAEARRVRGHLAVCSSCAAYVQSLARLETGLRRMRGILPPAGFVDQVLRRVRQRDSSGRIAAWLSWAGLAVAAAGLAILGLTVREWLAGAPDTSGAIAVLTSLLTMSPVEMAGSLGTVGSPGDWWQGLRAIGATALPLALGLIGLGGSIQVIGLVDQFGRRPIPGDS